MSKQFYPERLSEARKSKGLNMTDLANLVGVTRQAISAFERGVDSPTHETLLRLSSVLSIPREFFTLAPDEGSKVKGPIFFRSQITTKKKDREISSVKTNWLTSAYNVLSQYLEFPEVKLPDFGIGDFESLTPEDIEGIANQTRQYFGIGLGPISDLTKLLENHGIPIVSIDVASRIGAFSYATDDDRAFMVVERNSSAVRERFSLAHELGHLVMHKTLNQNFLEDKPLFKRVEEQANNFAGAFLMPAETFSREFYSPSISSLISMKKRWKVSISAMTMRAHSLGLITDNQKVYVFRQLAKNGKHREPLDDVIRKEESSFLRRAISLLEENRILSRPELKERLQIPTSDLAQFFNCQERDFLIADAKVVDFKLKSIY